MVHSEQEAVTLPQGKKLREIEDNAGQVFAYFNNGVAITIYQVLVNHQGENIYLEVEKPNLNYSRKDLHSMAKSIQNRQLVLATD